MIKKVHKLQIHFEVTDYKLPKNATIVQFCEDGHGDLCIWYVFQTEPYALAVKPEYVHRKLWVFGTDHEVPINLMHIGTAVCGQYVWHLFEGENHTASIPDGDMEGGPVGDHLREAT